MTDTDPIIAEIYVPEGPDVASVQSIHLSDAPKVADLLEAAGRAAELQPMAGEPATVYHERLCAMFHRDTGKLAPGKDAPAAMGRTDEERDALFDEWNAWLHAPTGLLRAAIRAIEPEWTP